MTDQKKKSGCKEWIVRVSMILISTVICIFLINLIFKKGEGEGSEQGINYSLINDSINQRNYDYAQLNPYQFTDKVRDKEKSDSVFRIAVLGDSFIWGDGLPYEMVWSHRLENKVTNKYPHIEVMSWGRNGWSTKQQLEFLRKHGKDYDIDYLIIGYVDNDPDMGDFQHMDPYWLSNPKWLYNIAPNLTYSIVFKFYGKSFKKWMNKIHSEDNLKKYAQLLAEFKGYTDSLGISVLFVMTPNNKYDSNAEYIAKVVPYVKKAGFDHINLVPLVNERFEDVPYDKLMANPVNHHPGDSLTKYFAEVTFKYLEDNKIIPVNNIDLDTATIGNSQIDSLSIGQ